MVFCIEVMPIWFQVRPKSARLTWTSASSLCAAAPIPASSGKRTRHRLNLGGNREANHALWRIVITHTSSLANISRGLVGVKLVPSRRALTGATAAGAI